MMTGGQLFSSCMRKYHSAPGAIAPCYAWAVQTVRRQAPQRTAVHGMGEYFAANGLGTIDPSMYSPMWAVGLKDLFKSQDGIAAECSAMPGATPDDIMTCAGAKLVASQSARAAIGVGAALGVLGAWFVLRKK